MLRETIFHLKASSHSFFSVLFLVSFDIIYERWTRSGWLRRRIVKINMKHDGNGYRAFKRPKKKKKEKERRSAKQQQTGTNPATTQAHNKNINSKHENITSIKPRMENRCGFDLQYMVNVLNITWTATMGSARFSFFLLCHLLLSFEKAHFFLI